MVKYTVFDPQDSITTKRHLTAREAVREILTYEGMQYVIKRDEDGVLQIWVNDPKSYSTRMSSSSWMRTMFCVEIEDSHQSREELYAQVIRWARDQSYGRTVLTDEEYYDEYIADDDDDDDDDDKDGYPYDDGYEED